jgi:two-component system phosphate regulon response regulator OmpR
MLRKRLLIVDDDPHLRKLLRLFLRDLPIEISEAATGEEAFAQIERNPWDVVLLDLILPHYGGFRICRKIRGGPHPEAWILMMTADESPEARETAIESGADEFLVKPFDPERVVEMVKARVGAQ